MKIRDRIEKAIRERLDELQDFRAGGGKVVAVAAAFAPPFEMVEAAGAVPVRLLWGGDASLEARGLRFLKNEACSLLKGILGAVASGVGIVPDAVVVGGACDQLRRSEEIFARDLGLPTFALAVPRAHGLPGAPERMRAELEWLGAELASFTGGNALSLDVLGERIAVWNRARRALGALDAARRSGGPGSAGTADLARSLWVLGPERFLSLTADLALPPASTEGRTAPLLLTGPPILLGDDLALKILEASGKGRIAADVCETGLHPHGAEVSLEGDPLVALAGSANAFPLGCGFKRPDEAFLAAVRAEAVKAGVEGILFKGLSFCAPWNHQAARFRRAFGLPFLALEGDYSGGQECRLKTRIEAFLESLEMRATR